MTDPNLCNHNPDLSVFRHVQDAERKMSEGGTQSSIGGPYKPIML